MMLGLYEEYSRFHEYFSGCKVRGIVAIMKVMQKVFLPQVLLESQVVLESSSILVRRLYDVVHKYFTKFLICVHSFIPNETISFSCLLQYHQPTTDTFRPDVQYIGQLATPKQCTMPENWMTLFTIVPRKVIFGSFTKNHYP